MPTDQKEMNLVSTLSNSDTKFDVKIKFACTLESSEIDQSVIQLFNTMYRRALRFLKLQQIGRNHYSMDDKFCAVLPQYNVKILPGMVSTIHASKRGLFFNADIIYKTLRTDTILDLIRDMEYKHRQHYQEEVRNTVRNTIILCKYNNRTVHVNDIDWTKTPMDTFKKRSGEEITYADYFATQYNMKITDMKQPLLVHKPKTKPGVEYYIPELCHLTGLTNDMKSDFNVMKALKESTGLNPTERAKHILGFVKDSAENADFAKVLKEWQFELEPKLLQLQGRVLRSETIKFGRNATAPVKMPSASWDIRTTPLFKGVDVDRWAVIAPPNSGDSVDAFLDTFFGVARPLGINLGRPDVMYARDNFTDYRELLLRRVDPAQTPFVMIILPNDKKELYDSVKQICCLENPVISQCVVLRTIDRRAKGIQSKATKIAVQIAAKLGGAPWTLQFQFPGPTMFVGLDVYHSGEIVNRKKQSVVGFTASMNASLSSYYSRVVVQDPGKEIVEALHPCIMSALDKFKDLNKIYPKYVIFYRDGVGEGQITSVLEHEVKSCLDAFEQLGIPETKLVYVVVLKKIHTRLFMQDGPHLSNPRPGTVVDTDITGNGAQEYFLVSQSVNQGTATPTRYQCIHNDCNLSSNHLQAYTYQLCHMYYNWFGTVRVPAPCLYAHKMAFLVGQSTHRDDEQRRLNNKLFFL